MIQGPLSKAVKKTLLTLRGAAELSDGRLLQSFIADGDEAAFETLVRRHGPMVLRTCQRVLHQAEDAEDAFQATFIVLARKAASVQPPEMLPNWLYGVAYRIALKARTKASKRSAHQGLLDEVPDPPRAAAGEATWNDVRPVLDQELQRLPEKYRAPLVLCLLEGKTIEDAARHLGFTRGQVAGALTRGRTLLCDRLAGRGVTLSAAGLTTLLAQNTASAVVPATLVAATVQTAGHAAAGLPASPALELADATVRSWHSGTGRRIAIGLALLLLVGGAVLVYRAVPAPVPVPFATLTGHTHVVTCLAFAPNGNVLASGGLDGTRLWRLTDGKEIASHPNRNARSLAFAPNGRLLAAGSYWGSVTLFDGVTGQERTVLLADGSFGGPVSVAFSPDGQTLATGTRDGDVRIWDVARVIAAPRQTRSTQQEGYAEVTWRMGDHNGRYRTVTPRQSVDIAVVEPQATFPSLAGKESWLQFSPDGQTLAVGNDAGGVRLLHVATGQTRVLRSVHAAAVHSLQFSRQGSVLFTGDMDGYIQRWDPATGKPCAPPLRHGHWGPYSLSVSADDRMLASSGWDGRLVVWDLAVGTPRLTLHASDPGGPLTNMPVLAVACRPDGKGIASAGADKKIRLWQIASTR